MREFTQNEIDILIKCPKTIITKPKKQLCLENGHYRDNIEIKSIDDIHRFYVFMRKHEAFEENFTIGLDYIQKDGSGKICLLRCNGPHGDHINDIEADLPHYNYHIHQAKDYNINAGLKSDRYAEVTEEYATFEDALVFFLEYCNIQDREKYFPKYQQVVLFPEQGG
ncbi:DUF6978 family protein [Dehalobacterium formicoaceticum]|uniref:DUF6978 family protein n=1 Tax=Dehalobacterium formicoaceticum TaxID=51515 RepID=UPI000B7DCED4|nr:hypothetical protein [Dehalobacterium formicoaceticum]